jgi:hypothetical protein
MKGETIDNGLRAMDIGALTTLGIFALTDRRKEMTLNL